MKNSIRFMVLSLFVLCCFAKRVCTVVNDRFN